ncbi:MAG: dienelactone hydrolase family protein [Longimicrobiales bacterium]
MRSYLMIGLGGVALIVGASVALARTNTGDRADQQATIPPGAADAVARLNTSQRHSEWVVVKSGSDSIRAWVVHPERRDNAPVVVVIHEIYGLSNWIRGVVDQLAADGFIAIAPDLLTMQNIPQTAEREPDRQAANAAIRTIQPADYQRQIRAVADYAMAMPGAIKKYGVVGYCWGGTAVFNHAIFYPDVGAVVSYYGRTPRPLEEYAKIKAPVLGLYGTNDAGVNGTIPQADSAMKALSKTYDHQTFEGAGHGFLRQQDQPANLEATKKAWPLTVAWFRRTLR